MAEPPSCDLDRIIRERRSVRAFRPEPVPRALIEDLIATACFAPSAGNGQPWKFIVIADAAVLAALAEQVRRAAAVAAEAVCPEDRQAFLDYAHNFTHFETAPVTIVTTFRPLRWGPLERGREDALIAASAAVQNLMLLAHARGLGSCLMTGPLIAEDAIKRVLAITESWSVHSFLPLGFPAEAPPAPRRRRPELVIRYLSTPIVEPATDES